MRNILTDSTHAAVTILLDLRRTPGSSSPACLWLNIGRAARSTAFRMLAKRGLIEVAYLGTGGVKNWRASAAGLALQPGEELSAVL